MYKYPPATHAITPPFSEKRELVSGNTFNALSDIKANGVFKLVLPKKVDLVY